MANKTFADIYEFDSAEEIIGIDIRESHESADESRKYLNALQKAAVQNLPVVNYKLKIRTKRGNLKTVEVHSQGRVANGRLISRTGVIRDITEEEKLREEVSNLERDIDAVTNDVDAVLHVFRQTLTQLSLLSQSAETFLARDPVLGVPPTDQELEEMVWAPLQETLAGVRTLATNMPHETFPAERQRLLDLAVALESYHTLEMPQWRDVWLEGVVEIVSIIERVAPGRVARSVYRPTIVAAERVGRYTALATLQVGRDAILAVDAPLGALREYITSGHRAAEPKQGVRLQNLVRAAIRDLQPFATIRHVQIQFDGIGDTYARVRRGAITRGIGNLLHNAIKYSWKRDDDKTRIRVSITADSAYATITVENWGVPIPQDEIETRLIFQLGYRGRLSSDRGRIGTGVGLTDSLRVAREHDGDVTVESRPARTGALATDYDQPFVTVVSMHLALVPRQKRKQDETQGLVDRG